MDNIILPTIIQNPPGPIVRTATIPPWPSLTSITPPTQTAAPAMEPCSTQHRESPQLAGHVAMTVITSPASTRPRPFFPSKTSPSVIGATFSTLTRPINSATRQVNGSRPLTATSVTSTSSTAFPSSTTPPNPPPPPSAGHPLTS